jgi:excisionase family DNA binding protein
MWEPDRRLLTIEEAAESVARPASTIRRWITEKRLAVTAHRGRQALVLEADVLEVDGTTRRGRPGTVSGT